MTTQSIRLGKQHLLEVAEGLFTEYGFQAVSIRDIAQAGGVTNAALYYHFSSKEALFNEVIEYHIDKLAQQMEQASAQYTNTRDKLTVILEEYASHVSERRSPLFSLRGKPDKVRPEKHQKQYAHLLGRLLAPLEIALDAGVARLSQLHRCKRPDRSGCDLGYGSLGFTGEPPVVSRFAFCP